MNKSSTRFLTKPSLPISYVVGRSSLNWLSSTVHVLSLPFLIFMQPSFSKLTYFLMAYLSWERHKSYVLYILGDVMHQIVLCNTVLYMRIGSNRTSNYKGYTPCLF